MYQAIGYAKDSKLPDYPKEVGSNVVSACWKCFNNKYAQYIAHYLTFELKKVSVELQNEDVKYVHLRVRIRYITGPSLHAVLHILLPGRSLLI